MDLHASPNTKPRLFLAAAAVMLFAFATLAFASPANADTATIAHLKNKSGETVASYTSVSDAKNAGCDAYADGGVIVMDADWDIGSDVIKLDDGKSLAIDMNGHKITDSNSAFKLGENAKLELTSSKKATFEYVGYNNQEMKWQNYTVTTGGLIGSKAGKHPAIKTEYGSTVTLDGVTVAGNEAGATTADSGAVWLDDSSTLNMKNGALIEHNLSTSGGGVCVYGNSVYINMNDSSISDNYGTTEGGGIYVSNTSDYVYIYMDNNSKVNGNAAQAGGGIYFFAGQFTLESHDGKGYVSGNRALGSSRTTEKPQQSGGGINVSSHYPGHYCSLIKNVTISDNYSAYDGGGIELDSELVLIKGCTITGNSCKYEGGGIYVCNNNDCIQDCTITNNVCCLTDSGNYEGGGLFVWHSYDIELRGVCIIKGNTRGKNGSADDVMLRENFGATAKAYITGYLDEGSSVGVRTGTTGDRRVAKNFSCTTKNGLFADLGGYYISYGTDEGGDAWQRHTTKEFTVKVNGQAVGKYYNGSTVTIEAPTAEAGKVFKGWSADGSTGLYPFADYVKDASSQTLTFEMPQNDVNLVASYADVKPTVTSVEAASITIAAAEDEQALRDLLPATAQAMTDAGATVSLTVKKDSFDLAASGLIVSGHVAPPAGGDTATLEIPVESADGSVTVPEGTTVKVTVTVTGNGADDGPEVPGFTDVDYSQWYADGVAFCAGNGLMTGYDGDDAGMFGTGSSLTRAELAAILWRIAEPAAAQAYACDEDNATGMADVDDNAWYTGAANWAVSAKVINGFGVGDHREFRPDAPVTAEQLAVILANYADPSGAAFADLGVLAEFADSDAISEWARASVAWASSKGIMNGYDAGYYRLLMPGEEIPRERAATILMNAFESGVLQ